MRYFFLLIVGFCIFSGAAEAQNLNGQWTGGFVSGGGFLSGETEYVLELEINGADVEGHSYTYFIINGKRCYVICKLKGVYEKGSKYLSVTEILKVKSNTPPDFRDCLQTHMLTFFKQGDKEVLKGSWKSASENDRCGTGATELQRKVLVKISPPPPVKTTSPSTAESKPPVKKPATSGTAKTKTPSTQNKTTAPTTVKKNPTPTTKKPVTTANRPANKTTAKSPPVAAAKPKDTVKRVESPAVSEKLRPTEESPVTKAKIPSFSTNKLEARNKNIIKTIEVPEAEFTVSLYDNGQIDGDTVTLYFNGKLIVSRQRLSTTPISVKIKLNLETSENDLVMIAENLGAIPPNTALMVVTVGDKRYEVNITSTEQINGTVRFKLKEQVF